MALTIGTITALPHSTAETPRFAAAVPITASAIAATTVASLTGTVNGLQTDMVLDFNTTTGPTVNAVCIGARCSATNVLQLDFINPTAGSVTPDALTYNIVAS